MRPIGLIRPPDRCRDYGRIHGQAGNRQGFRYQHASPGLDNAAGHQLFYGGQWRKSMAIPAYRFSSFAAYYAAWSKLPAQYLPIPQRSAYKRSIERWPLRLGRFNRKIAGRPAGLPLDRHSKRRQFFDRPALPSVPSFSLLKRLKVVLIINGVGVLKSEANAVIGPGVDNVFEEEAFTLSTRCRQQSSGNGSELPYWLPPSLVPS